MPPADLNHSRRWDHRLSSFGGVGMSPGKLSHPSFAARKVYYATKNAITQKRALPIMTAAVAAVAMVELTGSATCWTDSASSFSKLSRSPGCNALPKIKALSFSLKPAMSPPLILARTSSLSSGRDALMHEDIMRLEDRSELPSWQRGYLNLYLSMLGVV